eukprot:Phypoly_transcript_01258.p1 GENE.Phypoly_transcript_01258~~Phypoly_transcript_01258.p1  ORF type:complete len:1061 (+),score=123.38 Phypoly_transcript_01258:179-3361(+)
MVPPNAMHALPTPYYPYASKEELERERSRLEEIAKRSSGALLHDIEHLEWCNTHEKNGVKCSVAPRTEHDEFRAMGTVTIRRPPSTVYAFIMDMKSRPAWDKLLNEHKIVDEFTRDDNHSTLLWTMKFRPRYLRMKRRVTVLATYSGVHPLQPDGYMVSMMSVETPIAPVTEDEVACCIPVSGYVIVPSLSDPSSSVVTYVIRITIQNQLLGFMERTLMRTISQWAPPFAIIDRLSTLRSLIEERCLVSVVTTFPFMRESNFPPQFLRDFSYIKTDPMQSRDAVLRYYCGEDNDNKWAQVTSERGLVMKKFSGPFLHEQHNLALKLTFTTSNFIQFTLCLTDTDKRLIWEPCATRIEHIWDDGPMNICLKVVGGGPAKGRGCPKFEFFVYHMYTYGLRGDTDEVDSCVYEEHSDGNILLITLTSSNAGNSTLIDVYFFCNTDSYNDRSRTSITFLPNSPLPPIERTLLESVIEFRNVIELDTWLPSESIERLSLSDLAKSVTPQSRNSSEFGASPISQKRKQRGSLEEDRPLLGKMRSYFNKLPPLSSIFNSAPPPPPPNRQARSTSLHLLFASPPSKDMTDLINHLPYEILVHIFKFLPVEDVLPCAQVCHRTWQVANLDILWRDLMVQLHTERQRHDHDKWDKYIPPTYAPHAESQYFPAPFDVQIPTHTSSGDLITDSICSSFSSRSSSVTTMEDGGATPPSELEELTAEQRSKILKSSLDTIEGYASPTKLEYLQGLVAEKCWKYGVSIYVPCEALIGSEITCLSEHEHDNTLLAASRSGVVTGVGVASVNSPTSKVLFSLPASQHSAIQAQWKGDSILAVFSNGEVIEYDGVVREQKSRQFFTPMSGGFLYHNQSSPSSTLLVSHLHDKLRVFNVEDGSRLMKWTSSRGEITKTQVVDTCCVAVTSMHALYTVNVIDITTSSLLACLSGHQDEITGVRLLDKNGNLVTSSSKDGTIRVWDLRAGIHIAKQYCHDPGVEVNCFYTTPDKLVTGLSTGKVTYWDPRYINKPVVSFELPAIAQSESMKITNVHIARNSKCLMAVWDTGLFSTWIMHPC